MSDDARNARSRWEAMLFLRATPCPSCGRGPLAASSPGDSRTETASQPHPQVAGKHLLRIDTVCAACSETSTWTFTLRTGPTSTNSDDDRSPNQPSSLLDVGQWIMLSGLLLQDAERERDKPRSRNLKIEAGRCLEEAMKFYDDDENDLPPQSAIFTDATRERFRQAPQQFSRQRLIGARAKLPNARARTLGPGKPRSPETDAR